MAKKSMMQRELKRAKLVALIGVEDLVVVDTGDALLVCRASDDQRVKDVIEEVQHMSGLINEMLSFEYATVKHFYRNDSALFQFNS